MNPVSRWESNVSKYGIVNGFSLSGLLPDPGPCHASDQWSANEKRVSCPVDQWEAGRALPRQTH